MGRAALPHPTSLRRRANGFAVARGDPRRHRRDGFLMAARAPHHARPFARLGAIRVTMPRGAW